MHGNVPQRRLVVCSEHAYAREKATLEKKLAKEEEQLKKDIGHFGSHVFGCEKDAEGELAKLAKEYPLYRFQGQLVAVKKYARKGKPASTPFQELFVGHLSVEKRNPRAGHASFGNLTLSIHINSPDGEPRLA